MYPTAENIRKAREVLNAQHGWGGTEMMTAIRAALTPSDSQDHLRVVCFLTDGEVGNDLGILGEIQKHTGQLSLDKLTELAKLETVKFVSARR